MPMNYSTLEHNPPVFIFRLKKDGAFSPDLIAEMHTALDTIQNSAGEACLVVTGDGKVFSTGFDLEYFSTATGDERTLLMEKSVELLDRLLDFPLPTVAAINGHAFGMGALVALACDYRYMRADRGYLCLPEIDLKVAIPARNDVALEAEARAPGTSGPAFDRKTHRRGRGSAFGSC